MEGHAKIRRLLKMKKLNPEVYEIVMESIKDLRSNCAETELLR